jgi:hypothetical protein
MNEELLLSYIKSFYGYGSWQAPVWFVGPEEGGGGGRAEIMQGHFETAQNQLIERLAQWHDRGRLHLENVRQFIPDVNGQWFGPKAKRQKTWNRLIRVLRGIRRIDPNEPLAYQRTKWGTPDCDACDLSLFPLPSPTRKLWAYKHFLQLPQFAGRPHYENYYLDYRAGFLQQQIGLRANERPLTVIFYGAPELVGKGNWTRPVWYRRRTARAGRVSVARSQILLHSASECTRFWTG